jgi:hypothetical protein
VRVCLPDFELRLRCGTCGVTDVVTARLPTLAADIAVWERGWSVDRVDLVSSQRLDGCPKHTHYAVCVTCDDETVGTGQECSDWDSAHSCGPDVVLMSAVRYYVQHKN